MSTYGIELQVKTSYVHAQQLRVGWFWCGSSKIRKGSKSDAITDLI